MVERHRTRDGILLVKGFKLLNGVRCQIPQDVHTNIINLSRCFQLTESQGELLSRGLSFVPVPQSDDEEEIMGDIHAFHRRLKLLDHFEYETNREILPFMAASNWEPKLNTINPCIRNFIRSNNKLIKQYSLARTTRDNLSTSQRIALKELAKNKDIVIKPADKGSSIVIMDKQQYLLEANRQLSNEKHYTVISESISADTQKLVYTILQDLLDTGFINKKQKTYLMGPDVPRSRRFYLLPKVHADKESWTVPGEVPRGRPIVSDCGSETYKIAEYLDYFLNPLSQLHPSYLKDTYDFIEKIRSKQFPSQSFLFTIDVESLYTNINTELGLQAVKKSLEQNPHPLRPDNAILQLLEINLLRNDFEFDSQFFLQIQGTAMGKKFAPAYANIYMAEWERTLFSKCSHLPLMYFRYLDDVFGVWHHDEDSFHQFMIVANAHHTDIRLKSQIHYEFIHFLDTTVFFTEVVNGYRQLETKVFFKSTDTHCLLHKQSFHPKHTFKGLIKSQLIRFYRICSQEHDFNEATRILFTALRPRGYSKRFLRQIKADTLRELRNIKYRRTEPELEDIIPLVTTYSDKNKQLNHKIKGNFEHVQHEVTELQSFKVVSAYKRNPNLKDLLVRSTFRRHRTQASVVDLYFCPVKFVCAGNEGFPIKQQISLHTTNLVYMITCTYCNKRYVGETKHSISIRLKQHLYNIDNQKVDTHLVTHFGMHGVQHLRVTGLETDLKWTQGQRRRREYRWIEALQTWIPKGLNQR